jgi:hypothetical protein
VLFGIRRIEELICKVDFTQKLLLDDKTPFWKFIDTDLKELDDQKEDCGYLWGQFGELWYFIIMRMTQACTPRKKSEDA